MLYLFNVYITSALSWKLHRMLYLFNVYITSALSWKLHRTHIIKNYLLCYIWKTKITIYFINIIFSKFVVFLNIFKTSVIQLRRLIVPRYYYRLFYRLFIWRSYWKTRRYSHILICNKFENYLVLLNGLVWHLLLSLIHIFPFKRF